MNDFFGLDFGTSNSSLSVNFNGTTKIIDISQNRDTMLLKSVLYFDDEDRVFKLGQDAIESYIENDAEGRYMQSIKSLLSSKTFTSTLIGNKSYNIIDLVSIFFKRIKKTGEKKIGKQITKVVIGRPVIFSEDDELDQLAENRLREAAERVGFKEITFQYEPVAAAFTCLKQNNIGNNQIILVGDFGGGTSDFAIVKINKSGEGEVLATSGIYIGGNNFDSEIMWNKITKYFGRFARIQTMDGIITGSGDSTEMPSTIMKNLCQWHKIPILKTPKYLQSLQEYKHLAVKNDRHLLENLINLAEDNYGYMLFKAIESAKILLSSQNKSQVSFTEYNLIIEEEIMRLEFEKMIFEHLQKIERSIIDVVQKSGLSFSEINIVSLTGGTSLVPAVTNVCTSKFNHAKVLQSNVFTSVAFGLGL